jgi:hypothetical protein
VTPDEQLRWEADNGPKFAAVAFLSAGLTVASFAIQAATFSGSRGDREVLQTIHEHSAGVLIGRVVQVAAVITLVAALYYLWQAITARRPEGLQVLWPIGLLAPILLAIAGVTGYIDAAAAADDFVSGAQTVARANDIADDINGTVTKAVGQAGGLCLGLTYVLVSVNGMRTGLLSRFMGILGVVSGVLLVIPLLPGGIIQLFWIIALGALFLGRWPNGRGPAWEVVEAIPWPTAADVQAARQEAAEDEAGGPGTESGEAVETEGPGPPTERPASRKKKRRRGH